MMVYMVVQCDVYELPLGCFNTKSDAERYLELCNDKGIDAIIELVEI